MRKGFSFGSYVPGDSVMHKLDPRTKLLGGVVFIVACLLARDFAALVPVAVFVAALYALARIPVGKALTSLAPLLAIVVIASVLNLFTVQGGQLLFELGFIRVSEAGVYTCVLIASRLFLMMCGMSLITLTTMTLDLSEAFERLLTPFGRIGLPAHELGMIMGLALRFMPQFANELATVQQAQASRGAHFTSSPLKGTEALLSLITPLFTSVFRHAETLSGAMDARCYHGKDGRTRLHPLRFAAHDGAAAACLALLVACVVCAGAIF